MSEKKALFESKITLGNLMSMAMLLGALFGFALKYETRITVLETNDKNDRIKLDHLETIVERQSQTQERIQEILDRLKP